MNWRERAWATLFVGLGLGGLVFSSITAPAGAAQTRPHVVSVVALGDSITVLAGHDISADTAALGWTTTVDAHNGWAIDDWLPLSVGHPQALIVNLGTDDLWTDSNLQLLIDFDKLVTAVAATGARCVAFVTVTQLPELIGDLGGALLDKWIADLPGEHPGWQVIDWWTVSSADPGLYLSPLDGVHPTAAGDAWLGHAYASALQTCSPFTPVHLSLDAAMPAAPG